MRTSAVLSAFLCFIVIGCLAVPGPGGSTEQHGQDRRDGRGSTSRWSEKRISEARRRAITSNTTMTAADLPLPPSPTPSTPPSPVPTPMDLYVSYSVSTPCLQFITSTISSDTFTSCLPFSLLLTTSTSYATLVREAMSSGNMSTLNSLLAYSSSPQPSTETCKGYFEDVTSQMSDKKKCGKDLGAGKQLAQQFLQGVENYDVMRQAAGLRENDTAPYCYLEAISSDNPNDLYLWTLPWGVSLPSTYSPTCSTCSTLLLNMYAHSSLASSPHQSIIQTAIDNVNGVCGGQISATAAVTTKKGGSAHRTLSLSTDTALYCSIIIALGSIFGVL